MKFLFLIFSLNTSLFASDYYFGVMTDHFVDGNFNELNKVVMFKSNSGILVGSMTNSYDRSSFMFGYDYEMSKIFSYGIVMSTGYEPKDFYLDNHLDSLPVMPLPYFSIKTPIVDDFSLSLNFIAGVVFNVGFQIHFNS